MKLLYRCFFIVFTLYFPITSQAAPNSNEIKLWLSDINIHVKNGYFRKKYVAIDISNIKNVNETGKNTNIGPINSTTTLGISFDYFYNNIDIPCDATFTYEWVTITYPSKKHDLLTKIVNCKPT